MEKTVGTGSFDPQAIAVEYYFGDLSSWQLPAICIQVLEHGFDGRALRIIAGLVNLNLARQAKREIQNSTAAILMETPLISPSWDCI
jgi:hypothetical protein